LLQAGEDKPRPYILGLQVMRGGLYASPEVAAEAMDRHNVAFEDTDRNFQDAR